MGRKKHFYAVSKGRTIGIYTCFNRAHEQVDGFRGGCQQGFETLLEAQQVMRKHGYPNPLLFDHRSESVQACSSDSELEIPAFTANSNSTDTNETKPVLTVEHTDHDIETLFVSPRRTSSDTIVYSHTPVSDFSHIEDPNPPINQPSDNEIAFAPSGCVDVTDIQSSTNVNGNLTVSSTYLNQDISDTCVKQPMGNPTQSTPNAFTPESVRNDINSLHEPNKVDFISISSTLFGSCREFMSFLTLSGVKALGVL